jgi:predicted RNase H-like HicB family nuclease
VPTRQITIRLTTEDDGSMWATVDELPGVFATGDSLEEVQECLTEAIALYLTPEDQPSDGALVEVHLEDCHETAVAEAHAQLVVA